MRKYGFLVLLLAFTAANAGAVDIAALTRAVQNQGRQNAQFEVMRDDLAQAQKEKYTAADLLFNTQKENNRTALAVYLYNMYVLQDAYGPHEESALSLNDLGALDAVCRLKTAFPYPDAEKLYRKNHAEIQGLIAGFFRRDARVYPQDTAQEERWITLLTRAFSPAAKRIKPFYTLPEILRLQGEAAQADVAFLTPALRAAQAQGEHLVILFEKTQASLEDLDSRLARGGGRTATQYTYRRVKDECEYSTYLLGKQLLQTAAHAPQKWGRTRLYKITARPDQTDFYLRPASGERFTLADGTAAAKWQYHTALLAVLNTQQGEFVPVVFDAFLGRAEQPLTLEKWLAHFDKGTQFEAVPFETDRQVDAAIRTPERILPDGKRIEVDRRIYSPAPIEE